VSQQATVCTLNARDMQDEQDGEIAGPDKPSAHGTSSPRLNAQHGEVPHSVSDFVLIGPVQAANANALHREFPPVLSPLQNTSQLSSGLPVAHPQYLNAPRTPSSPRRSLPIGFLFHFHLPPRQQFLQLPASASQCVPHLFPALHFMSLESLRQDAILQKTAQISYVPPTTPELIFCARFPIIPANATPEMPSKKFYAQRWC
jgi:hypothetical protein